MTDRAMDVWLYFDSPDGEDPSHEANTYKDVAPDGTETYRVEWSHTAVGQITTVTFTTYEQARAWLEAAGYQDFTS